MNVRFALQSPIPNGQAAISVVSLRGDVDAALAALGAAPEVRAGRAVLRSIPGIDTLIIARTGDDHAFVFPHAGPTIVRRLFAALERAGARREDSRDPANVDERLTAALARAHSPLAIDLLLDQPRRWEAAARGELDALPEDANARLRFLLDPPTVVALGPPNIGKSSLLNALAGRAVSIVADEPGTTRDHVGVLIDMAGLVVRFIDAPGLDTPSQREGAGGWVQESQTAPLPHITPNKPTPHPSLGEGDRSVLAEAQRLGIEAAAGADLVLLCADAGSRFLAPPAGVPSVRVALRADLGVSGERHDVRVSARSGEGIEALVGAIREALVPEKLLGDPRAWAL